MAPGEKSVTLSIRYTQKLAADKFIYTPLIPKMEKGKDYGSITIAGDRPLRLVDSKSHEFSEKDGKLVVKPADRKAIVIDAGQPVASTP